MLLLEGWLDENKEVPDGGDILGPSMNITAPTKQGDKISEDEEDDGRSEPEEVEPTRLGRVEKMRELRRLNKQKRQKSEFQPIMDDMEIVSKRRAETRKGKVHLEKVLIVEDRNTL